MSANQAECSRCGKTLMTDGRIRQPVVCAACRERLQLNFSRGAYRPLPTVGAAVALADGLDDYPVPTWQLAFTEAMPWAMSIAFHLAILLVLTFITCFAEPQARGGVPGAEDEIIGGESRVPTHPLGTTLQEGSNVVTNNPTMEAYGKGTDPRDFSAGLSAMPEFGTKGGGSGEGSLYDPLSIPGIGPNAGGDGNGTGIGSSELGSAFKPGNGLGKGFFIHGQGPRGVMRVLFLVDKSGSMNLNFDYVKVELKRCIGDLDPRQEFQVVMFADGPPDEMKISNKGGLHHANKINKAAAFAWIKTKYAKSEHGVTSPVESFKRAFSIQPDLPQLIYVLTDGGFDQEVLDYLRQVNKDKNGVKVMINTIGFARRDGEEVLTKMAKENGGTYHYVDESDLKNYSHSEE